MSPFRDMPPEALAERAKELECLYLMDEALTDASLPRALQKIAEIIPLGFRNIGACAGDVYLDGVHYRSRPPLAFRDEISADLLIGGVLRGTVKAWYPKGLFSPEEDGFLPQERRLLRTIANRISDSVYQRELKSAAHAEPPWKPIIELLKNTDHEMLLYVCEKMMAVLAKQNQELLADVFDQMNWSGYKSRGEVNSPLASLPAIDVIRLSQTLFAHAAGVISDAQIHENISLWIYQKKTSELVKIVHKKSSDIKSILQALEQYRKAVAKNRLSNEPTRRWLTAELIRRFLTARPRDISRIQEFLSVDAFCDLLDRMVGSQNSSGTIGGKGTGFFLANQILRQKAGDNPLFENFKMPATWYIASDELQNLIDSNGFSELNEHKYLDLLDLRIHYPRIIQMLKNAKLSPYIINQLDQILDECPDKPLIIRSSSALEDQEESSFSGKYKSLFITNTGTKLQRRQQLIESILEVYASLYNPDSIQYRKQRGLIDCAEEMAILVQEVVGTRVGPYFFPLCAGVAFSSNELRWSPRIRREDGLLRMVMGLGTRAVDRIGEDFPILISPGQPNLAVNQSPEDLRRYAPQMMDVLDLEKNQFVTLPVSQVLRECGQEIPGVGLMVSSLQDDIPRNVNALTTDFKSEELIVTGIGLTRNTKMLRQIREALSLLRETLGYPVDVEFAYDGESLYLLQCRAQSRSKNYAPAPIPAQIPPENLVFTAGKFVSNGRVTGIKTVIYVSPEEYAKLERYEDVVSVAAAVGELNRMLPPKSFILMGPGRWGSRGDVRLGVPVNYSDINHAAMLIEIAGKESKYQPELSFGTHFFQDLVEENIKYLPLYPQDEDTVFNKDFFALPGALERLLPAYSHLKDVIRVIQTEDCCSGKQLRVAMNGDLERAVAYLDFPGKAGEIDSAPQRAEITDQPWKWRYEIAERIADQMDLDAFGVKGIYLFGSTYDRAAGPDSDIDLLIHFGGDAEQKRALDAWLRGWSLALSELNFSRTGRLCDGLLDVHYITDEDIAKDSSFALKLKSPDDSVLPLRVRK